MSCNELIFAMMDFEFSVNTFGKTTSLRFRSKLINCKKSCAISFVRWSLFRSALICFSWLYFSSKNDNIAGVNGSFISTSVPLLSVSEQSLIEYSFSCNVIFHIVNSLYLVESTPCEFTAPIQKLLWRLLISSCRSRLYWGTSRAQELY